MLNVSHQFVSEIESENIIVHLFVWYVCIVYTHCKYSIIQFFCNIITMRWSQIILLKFWQAQVRVPRPSPGPAHQIQKGKVHFGLRPVTKIIKTTHPLTFRGSEREYIVSIPALHTPEHQDGVPRCSRRTARWRTCIGYSNMLVEEKSPSQGVVWLFLFY